VEDNGSMFVDVFDFYPGFSFCNTYNGMTLGDSGGALISGNKLCGIISSMQGVVGFALRNQMAAVDSHDVTGDVDLTPASPIDWLKQIPYAPGNVHIVNPKGYFDGECPNYYAKCVYGMAPGCDKEETTDTDGDGVMDICDSCPKIPNPEQLSVDDDPDNDGYGAACDFCPGHYSQSSDPQIANCNYDAELANAYPGLSTPPLPKTAAEKVKYLKAFKPDACDKAACPSATLSGGAFYHQSLVPGISSCGLAGGNCPQIGNCDWRFNSSVDLRPLTHASDDFADIKKGTPVDVGLRWCPCPSGSATAAERYVCQSYYGCKYKWDEYNKTGAWRKISTFEQPGSATRLLGAEFALPLNPFGNVGKNPVDWAFLDLGVFVNWEHQSPATCQGQGIKGASVMGVLWSSIQSLTGGTPSTAPPSVHQVSHVYTSGDATMELTYYTPQFVGTPKWYLDALCIHCPEGITKLTSIVGNPVMYKATPEGVQPDPSARIETKALFDQIASGLLIYVPAAEPLGQRAGARGEGAPLLHGVAVDSTHWTIAAEVESLALDVSPAPKSRVGVPGTPVMHGDEAVVLSAVRRQLMVLGGTVDGTIDGAPEPSAWILGVESNTWTEHPLAAEQRPGRVLGATYRHQDGHVYLIDLEGGIVRLRRWQPEGDVEIIARMPASWASFEESWLVAGPGGDLVFAGSNQQGHSEAAMVARLTFDEVGGSTGEERLQFAGTKMLSATILAAPIGGMASIGVIVDDSAGGKLASVHHDELTVAGQQELPVIYG